MKIIKITNPSILFDSQKLEPHNCIVHKKIFFENTFKYYKNKDH